MTEDRKWTRSSKGTGTIADDVIQNGHSGVTDNTFFSQSGAGTADYDPEKKSFSVAAESSELALELPKDFSSKD